MANPITLGGKEYDVPPMKFKQLKAIWPRIKTTFDRVQDLRRTDPQKLADQPLDGVQLSFDAVEDAAFIIGTAMQRVDPAHTPEWVVEQLDPSDLPQLTKVINQLMIDSNLVKPTGKSAPAVEDAPPAGSTATGTP